MCSLPRCRRPSTIVSSAWKLLRSLRPCPTVLVGTPSVVSSYAVRNGLLIIRSQNSPRRCIAQTNWRHRANSSMASRKLTNDIAHISNLSHGRSYSRAESRFIARTGLLLHEKQIYLLQVESCQCRVAHVAYIIKPILFENLLHSELKAPI